MSCGVGHKCGLDPTLLWLWCRLVATALIQPLAWEPPYAAGAALERAKRQKKKNQYDIYTKTHTCVCVCVCVNKIENLTNL